MAAKLAASDPELCPKWGNFGPKVGRLWVQSWAQSGAPLRPKPGPKLPHLLRPFGAQKGVFWAPKRRPFGHPKGTLLGAQKAPFWAPKGRPFGLHFGALLEHFWSHFGARMAPRPCQPARPAGRPAIRPAGRDFPKWGSVKSTYLDLQKSDCRQFFEHS